MHKFVDHAAHRFGMAKDVSVGVEENTQQPLKPYEMNTNKERTERLLL
jgi:hypothetical protein